MSVCVYESKQPAQSLDGFSQTEDTCDNHNKPRKLKTIAEQFREQLLKLVSFLQDSSSHYVRCIKPNDTKRAGFFHQAKVHEQLTNCGLVDTVQLRKVG